MIKKYKALKVWRSSYQLRWEVYRIIKGFPKQKGYGLMLQVRRAVCPFPVKRAGNDSTLEVRFSQLDVE